MKGVEITYRRNIETDLNGYAITFHQYVGGQVRYMVSRADGDYICHNDYNYYMTEIEARAFCLAN